MSFGFEFTVNSEGPTQSQSQQQCPTCGNFDFEIIDGQYYCSLCFTQSQVQHELITCIVLKCAYLGNSYLGNS